MSRTTYGLLSFKIPGGDLEGDELIAAHKAVLQEMVAVLKRHGGSLVKLEEVMEKADHPAEDYLAKESIKDFTEET